LLLQTLEQVTGCDWTREGIEELFGRWIRASAPVESVEFRWHAASTLDRKVASSLKPAALQSPANIAVEPIEYAGGVQGELRATLVVDAEWTAEHSDAMRRFARAAGFFLAQREAVDAAQRLACRDELTGLFNRRRLREALDEWIPRARRERRPVSVVLLDVDHFKSINDAWGHSTGDRVLQMIAELLQSSFRSQDVVCRYGGEEFCVLLCDHRAARTKDHPTEALFFAERVRRAAESTQWTTADGQALSQVTLSGGIATYPWDGATAQELLQRADEALYDAKRSGRNRIQLARGLRLAG
jgi:diguanylate cyclase (GGDEF)-like protein